MSGRGRGASGPICNQSSSVTGGMELAGALPMDRPRKITAFPIEPPVEPMLAKLADELPEEGTFLYEPKWDGFRSLVFRSGQEVFIQSRDSRPFDRYFPDLHEVFLAKLPP